MVGDKTVRFVRDPLLFEMIWSNKYHVLLTFKIRLNLIKSFFLRVDKSFVFTILDFRIGPNLLTKKTPDDAYLRNTTHLVLKHHKCFENRFTLLKYTVAIMQQNA